MGLIRMSETFLDIDEPGWVNLECIAIGQTGCVSVLPSKGQTHGNVRAQSYGSIRDGRAAERVPGHFYSCE